MYSFIEDEITLNQDGNLAVRVHDGNVFRLIEEVYVSDFEVHTLFEQHKTAAVAEGAGGS
jgi:hypothetical protein